MIGVTSDASTILLAVLISCSTFALSPEHPEANAVTRRKRYVVFPEGSSFSIALCLTMHTLTPADNIFTEGINWGISYDLPNESKPELDPFLSPLKRKDTFKQPGKYNKYDHEYRKPGDNRAGWNYQEKKTKFRKKYNPKADYHYVQRRHRRDLYAKMETVINAMGFDGRSCVLRALCEASQKLMPKGNSLVEEMIRIVFSMPLKKLFDFEPAEHHQYVGAHEAGHRGKDCEGAYPRCGFSLLDMALGKYDASDFGDDYNDYLDINPALLHHYIMK